MLDLWLGGLACKVSEAGRESISKRWRQGFDEARAGTRSADDALALMAREELAGGSGCWLPDASVGAYLSDCGRAGLDKNFAATFIAVKNDGTVSRGGS